MTTDPLSSELSAAGDRLGRTRPTIVARAPWPLAERFDESPEAEWGPPEVLAHVAEMIPFWQGELARILAGGPRPVPFGRVATDAVRLAVLERDRTLPVTELFDRVDDAIDRFARRWASLTPEDRARVGLHPRLGEMTIAAIAERFVVSHLADHAVQLEAILGLGPMES